MKIREDFGMRWDTWGDHTCSSCGKRMDLSERCLVGPYGGGQFTLCLLCAKDISIIVAEEGLADKVPRMKWSGKSGQQIED